MRFNNPDTGEMLDVSMTRELSNLLRTRWENQCPHEVLQPRRRMIAGGHFQVREQCLSCGEAVGRAHSKLNYLSIDDFDEDLLSNRIINEERARWDIVTNYIKSIELKELEWKKSYNTYLSSENWRKLRHRVFKRANGVCEGCGLNGATEVHHLTYENFGNEFLFELIAICKPCHDRIHARDSIEHSNDFDDRICRGCRNQGDGIICPLYMVDEVIALAHDEYCGGNHEGFEPLK